MQIRRSEWGLEIEALWPVHFLRTSRRLDTRTIHISARIHGDESAGCEAMITWTEKNWLFSGVGPSSYFRV